MTTVTTDTWLERLIAFLRRLLRLEKDIQKITKPITKITNELEKLAEQERAKANREVEAAAMLLGNSERRKAAASEAQAFAAGLPKFGTPAE